ncbi:hypothetical protein [Telluribacter sp.]|jgi:hypothetical protein|uniref:hypothetical protein n=1 Tax=Telluribacter sp. TaxID=1978767 RepID=UPI002E0F1A43|nr:hypothetical protein [Telluribacter sp.]
MKALKLLTVMMLISLLSLQQAGATGYAHNMFAAQKMLKSKKEARKTPVTATRTAVVAASTGAVSTGSSTNVNKEEEVCCENSAVALTQQLARWIVGLVYDDSNTGDEKAGSQPESREGLSLNGWFVTLAGKAVYGLLQPARVFWQ